MSRSEPTVTIVLCAYTAARWTLLCTAVQELQRQTRPPQEIILVIDHNPALLERARIELRGVTVLANQHARGLAGARNTGVAAATGDLIAFMDEDAQPESDWLERLIAPYADPRVLGVGGAIEPHWEKRPAWFPEEFQWVVGCTFRGMPEHAAPVRNLIGCNMSFRREALHAVEGFRNDLGRIGALPIGCEETELCIRLGQRFPQSILLYEPRARVQHHVPVTRSNWTYFFARCHAEGRSKAQVTQFVGGRAGLATERRYTVQTLPRGVLRNIAQGVRRADPNAWLRAVAIITGLGITTAGYLLGLSRSRRPAERETQMELDAV